MNKSTAPHNKSDETSEEIQDIMGRMPVWITKWSFGVFTIFLGGLLVALKFFSYPEILLVKLTIKPLTPHFKVTSRISGRIENLFVKDGEIVIVGQNLVLLENNASIDDLLLLKDLLYKLTNSEDLKFDLEKLVFERDLELGDLTLDYHSLVNVVTDYLNSGNESAIWEIKKRIQTLSYGIKKWENLYLIKSKIAGKVTLYPDCQVNALVKVADPFMGIDNLAARGIRCIGFIPAGAIFNVHVGQDILITPFDNLPQEQLNGTIQKVSSMPLENGYLVDIKISPDGALFKKIETSRMEIKCVGSIVTGYNNLIDEALFHKK